MMICESDLDRGRACCRLARTGARSDVVSVHRLRVLASTFVVLAVIALMLVGCGKGRDAATSDANVDRDSDDWMLRVTPARDSYVVSWSSSGSAAVGLLQVVGSDGSIHDVGSVGRPNQAPSPDGSFVAVSDYRISNGVPKIEVVSPSPPARRAVTAGLLEDRAWQNLVVPDNESVIWLREGRDWAPRAPVYDIVRSSVATGETTTIASFAEVDWFELSPDRSKLAVAAASRPDEGHDLWVVDLRSLAQRRLSEGVDVQFIRWLHNSSGLLEAKQKPVGSASGSGPGDAGDFFLRRYTSPGGIFRWSERGELLPVAIDLGPHVPGEFSVSPNGETLAVSGWRARDGAPVSGLWLVDLDTLRSTLVSGSPVRPTDGQISLFSGDGQHVAFHVGDQIIVQEVANGARFTLNPRGTSSSLLFSTEAAWDAEGNFVFFSNMRDAEGSDIGRMSFWRWRAGDGELELLATRPDMTPRP